MSRPIEFLRKAKHPDAEAGIRGRKTDVTLSMETAREMGMFSDGHLVADNTVVVEPGVSFSIEAYASLHKFREFSTDKMGIGEGHRAFGWGLYFSGGKESNEQYYRQFASYRMRYGVDGAVEENESAG